MNEIDLDKIKKTVLGQCRIDGNGGLGTAISWPIPITTMGRVNLMFFIYPSTLVSQKAGIVTRISRPYLEVQADSQSGEIIKKYQLRERKDDEVSFFPDKKAELIPTNKWSELINELEGIYPVVMENYRQRAPIDSKVFDRFMELFTLLTPDYLLEDYHHLNQDFFKWIYFKQTKTGGDLQARIINTIRTLSKEDLDNMRRDDLKYLSQDQISTYIYHAIENERSYFLGMRIKTDAEDSEVRNGTFTGWVAKDKRTDKWVLTSGGGLIPVGLIMSSPLMVSKEVFIKEMEIMGVPKEYIDKLIGGNLGITS